MLNHIYVQIYDKLDIIQLYVKSYWYHMFDNHVSDKYSYVYMKKGIVIYVCSYMHVHTCVYEKNNVSPNRLPKPNPTLIRNPNSPFHTHYTQVHLGVPQPTCKDCT